MKKILLFSLVTLALMFLIVSCAPQTQQTNEERLTEQMHSSSAIAGMAIRIRCATTAVTNCRTAAGNIYFTYRGANYIYPTASCSGSNAYNAYAYNSRCVNPTTYENCIDRCEGSELCNAGVCAVRRGDCLIGGEPSRCLAERPCTTALFRWLPFDLDADEAPRGCYASCPPGVVDSNGDRVCRLADGVFGCSANNMCESNNCNLARNTCVAALARFCYYLAADGSRLPAGVGLSDPRIDRHRLVTEAGAFGISCYNSNDSNGYLGYSSCGVDGISGVGVRIYPGGRDGLSMEGCAAGCNPRDLACCTASSSRCSADGRSVQITNVPNCGGRMYSQSCGDRGCNPATNECYRDGDGGRSGRICCGDGVFNLSNCIDRSPINLINNCTLRGLICVGGNCTVGVAPPPPPAPLPVMGGNFSSVCCGDSVFNISRCDGDQFNPRNLQDNCTLRGLVCVLGDNSAKCSLG